MAGRKDIPKDGEWQKQDAYIVDAHADNDEVWQVQGTVRIDDDGFILCMSSRCSCDKHLQIKIQPTSKVTFVVELLTEYDYVHQRCMRRADLARMLEDPFQVIDYCFQITCFACLSRWDCRVWPCRPHFLQFQCTPVTGVPLTRPSLMINTQKWHFPSQVQWAMWLANPKTFSFNDGKDGSIEASRMIEGCVQGGSWADQCDTWTCDRPDLADASRSCWDTWLVAASRGVDVMMRKVGTRGGSKTAAGPLEGTDIPEKLSDYRMNHWNLRVRCEDWQSPLDSKRYEILMRDVGYVSEEDTDETGDDN